VLRTMECTTDKTSARAYLEGLSVSVLVTGHNLVYVTKDTTTGQALKVLAENHILACPVRDDEQAAGYKGFVDVLDIVAELVEQEKDKSLDPETFLNKPVSDITGKSKKDEWITVPRTESVLALLGTFARGVHRVSVLASDGSGKIESIITQTDLLHFLLENEEHFGSILSLDLQQLNLVKQWVLFVGKSERAIKCYQKMDEHKVSAIAVLDDKTLVASISASDIRGIATAKEFKALMLPCMDFLAKQRGGDLELREICKPESLLLDVCKTLLAHHFHRLWVTDHSLQPVGVVSLTDICNTLLLKLA